MESEFSMLKGIPDNAKYQGTSVFSIKISMENHIEVEMVRLLNDYLAKEFFLHDKDFDRDGSKVRNNLAILRNIEKNEIKNRMMENGIICNSRIIGVRKGSVEIFISIIYYSFDTISKVKNFRDSIKIISEILEEIFLDFTRKCFDNPEIFSISSDVIDTNIGKPKKIKKIYHAAGFCPERS